MSERLTKEYDNPMCRQAMSLPELIRSQYEDLEPKTRKVLSFQEIFNIQRVVLTGCGDSYAACMATKHVFEMLTGIQAEVVTAIDFGRYYSERHMGVDCQNPLVIAVSNSGRVARISEAVQRAKFHDCFVLGITGNLTSPLAQNSDKVLKLDIPPFESAPGTRSYMVSVMALLLLAVRIGEVRGMYTMDQAMDYRYDMKNQGDLLEALLPQMAETCAKTAEEWKDFPCFDFVGAGFDYAAVWPGEDAGGHRKIFHAYQLGGMVPFELFRQGPGTHRHRGGVQYHESGTKQDKGRHSLWKEAGAADVSHHRWSWSGRRILCNRAVSQISGQYAGDPVRSDVSSRRLPLRHVGRGVWARM